MYPEALPLLRCLICPSQPLRIEGSSRFTADGAISQATLRCIGCGARYPIRNQILDTLDRPYQPTTPAQVVNEIPATAWIYEPLWRHRALSLLSGEPFGYNRELPLIVGLIAPQYGGMYLDTACSSGLYARAIAAAIPPGRGHVIAVDHAWPMLRMGVSLARRAGLRISFVCAEAQRLPLASALFAGIAMGGSLNEIGDRNACLTETRRLLAPHGTFVSMHLVAANKWLGRVVQLALTPSGVVFPSPQILNQQFLHHRLRVTSWWRYGTVMIGQYRPV